MRVKKKWIKNRKSFAERMACQHWWELKLQPNILLSFVANPYYVVCKKCGHRGTLSTKMLDPYEVRQYKRILEEENQRIFANSGEEEE